MRVTLNKHSALAVLRSMRVSGDWLRAGALSGVSEIAAPDPSPRKRWSKRLVAELRSQLPCELNGGPLDVAVPSGAARMRTAALSCTVYEAGIPPCSFIDVGNGVVISGPELLFVELAETMRPIEHLMLGHELCGSFCRDAADPYNGRIIYGARPLTSVGRIQAFLEQAKCIRGIDRARESVRYLNDNAWSPTESLVAALLVLPVDSLGFDLGPLELNPRFRRQHELPGSKASRVPDILFAGTSVGLNYDGLVHLDLGSIVEAAIEVGAHPGASHAEGVLANAVRGVRAKALDDIRRNRELATDGLSVFPIVKEDLYVSGGIDQVVEQLLRSLETLSGRDVSSQRKTLKQTALSKARHRTILSLLPGNHERDVQVGRFIQGHELVQGECTVNEYWIEL